ncbi:MAG: hypothetical protein ACOC2H_03685 [Spirochaetota bacterium]
MKTILTVVLSVLFSMTTLSAGTMVVTDGVYTPFSTTIINNQVRDIADDLNDEAMIKLSGNQDNLATATHSSNASLILQGSLFTGLDAENASVSIGTGIGTENAPDLPNFADHIENGKDESTSVALGGIVGSVYFNADSLIGLPIPGLIFNFTGGGYTMDNIEGYDLSYESYLVGGGVRYKFYNIGLQEPMFQVRDFTVGTGVYYSNNETTFIPEDIEKTSSESQGFYTRSNTELEFQMKSTNLTIPVDVVTSAKTINFINLIGGVGVDFTFGETEIDVKSDTSVTAFDSDDNVVETNNPAKMRLTNSKTTASAPVARFKTIIGLGLNFDPVRIDVPIAIYPTSGYTAALMVGGVF